MLMRFFYHESDATFLFGTPFERAELALDALREGRGVMVLDDEDLKRLLYILPETMTVEQMGVNHLVTVAVLFCLCITEIIVVSSSFYRWWKTTPAPTVPVLPRPLKPQ